MKLFIIEQYKEEYPELKGRQLTEALVRSILEEQGIIEPQILRTDRGKPYLAGNELYFSVSHSEDMFACLLADCNVGLDIQQLRDVRAEALARKYFTEEEYHYMKSRGEDGFFRLWTRKEAFAKYTGRGLEEILQKVPVLGRSDVIFTDLSLGDGLYGSCCCGIEEEEHEISVSRRE